MDPIVVNGLICEKESVDVAISSSMGNHKNEMIHTEHAFFLFNYFYSIQLVIQVIMGNLISPVGISLGNNSEDVPVLTHIPATASTSTDSTERVLSTNENLPKTIREKFYVDIKTYETKWSGQCTLCNEIQYDSKGVTSSLNRHVKNQHADAYREWLNQLNDLKDKDHKKICDVFVRSIG